MTDNDKLRETDIKDDTRCYLDNLINIKNLNFKNIQLGKQSQKDIFIYYKVLYDLKYHDESKYLTLIPIELKDKDVQKKYQEMFELKFNISDNYDEKTMKIRFNLDKKPSGKT